MIEAERNLRAVELDYHAALADVGRRWAEVERAVGAWLDVEPEHPTP